VPRLTAIAFLLIQLGCQSEDPRPDFIIAAAADLRYAMDELVPQFQQRHSEVQVRVTYGSSGIFAQQIAHGAPYDIFCSADLSYPQALARQGLTVEGSEFLYAIGRIVVWARSSSEIPVEELGIQALLDPSIRHIAVANPGHAPYGKAAVEALRFLGIYEAVQDKLVFGENVSQTLQYIQSGSADIGIIALSLAVAPPARREGLYWEIPSGAYARMDQGGVILKSSRHPELADEFRSFMLAEESRSILKQYGFYLPGDAEVSP
jgi:molybdate transport system substrate-binding protein